jgi:4-amino-4-deoxy-L-arabinose transferase-like glycosyltransferase
LAGRKGSSRTSPGGRKAKLTSAFIVIVVLVYLALSLGSSMSKSPWHDEGHFASPALNLATRGFMGTTVLEGGTWLKGIEQHTYWVMPLYLVALAGWFKIFGFSFFVMRALSAFWGLVALASWFFIMKRLADDRAVALVSFAFIAIDYIFIMNASTGRMDMMSAALGFAGLACYLNWREGHLTRAVLATQTLVVASGLTHPNGLLPFAGLLFLTLYFDRARLRWQHVGVAAAPYVVGALCWGAYILRDPPGFRAQLSGNVGGFSAMTGANRWVGLTAPWTGIKLEITQRYLGSFGLAAHSVGPARLKLLVLAAYVCGVLGVCGVSALRRHGGYRVLLILTGIFFVLLSLLEGHKSDVYLINMIPLLAALLAVWVVWCWRSGFAPRWLLAVCLAGFVTLQAGGVAYLIKQNYYRSRYLPVTTYLKQHLTPNALTMGSAELGFEIGFDRLIDDVWLGYYSGKSPDFIVMGSRYEDMMRLFQTKQPEVYRYAQTRLSGEYRLVYEAAPYWKVYQRR